MKLARAIMNTANREREQRNNDAWDANACAVTHTAHPLWRLASYQRKLGNFGSVGILLEEIRLQRIVLCE